METRGAGMRRACVALIALAVAIGAAVPGASANSASDPEFSGLAVQPVAFFPLLGEQGLTSSSGLYEGKIVGGDAGVTFVESSGQPLDLDLFPRAVRCHEGEAGLIELPSVPYGTEGPFSLNLWIRQQAKQGSNETGEDAAPSGSGASAFEYIFSHAAKQQKGQAFFPFAKNQVHVFLPKASHPAHGIVRAIVKDGSDEYEGLKSQTYLDSDGRFMDNAARNVPGHVDLEDGNWHMVTVTTQPSANESEPMPEGFRMYVDGVLAGEAPPALLMDALAPGLERIPEVHYDGGLPLELTGKIHLCGRVDRDEERHFGGDLAHLSLWDVALTDQQVGQMFATVMGEAALEERCVEVSETMALRVTFKEPCPYLDLNTPDAGLMSTSDEMLQINDDTGPADMDYYAYDLDGAMGDLRQGSDLASLGGSLEDIRQPERRQPMLGDAMRGVRQGSDLESLEGAMNDVKTGGHLENLEGALSDVQQDNTLAGLDAAMNDVKREDHLDGSLAGQQDSSLASLDSSLKDVQQDNHLAGLDAALNDVQREDHLDGSIAGQQDSTLAGLDSSLKDVRQGSTLAGLDDAMSDVRQGDHLDSLDGALKDVRQGSTLAGLDDAMIDVRLGDPLDSLDGSMRDVRRGSDLAGLDGALGDLRGEDESCLSSRDCLQGLLCILPRASGNRSDGVQKAGKCAAPPVGGIFPPDPNANVPFPLAFFPLTGGDVSSWPTGEFQGDTTNTDWVPDVLFENTLSCSESVVRLPNVKYGRSGTFAINLWMRVDPNLDKSRGDFEYVFSHGQAESGGKFNPFGPNQVHLYLPKVAHPAHGVLRTVVKDSESTYGGLLSQTFFDSDGKFMDNSARDTAGHVDLEDGVWHMVTLTTKPSKEAGYEVYVDGMLGGSYPPPELDNFLGPEGGSQDGSLGDLGDALEDLRVPDFHVDGGAPMNLTGDIYLCGRSDMNEDRHFKGQLAHLEVFDRSLNAEQVGAIYTAVKGHSLLVDSLLDLANSIRALQPNETVDLPTFLRTPESTTERAGYYPTSLCQIDTRKSGLVSPQGCGEGLVCAATQEGGGEGVCVATPDGGIYEPSAQVGLPVPKAYFPLTGGSLTSWPVPDYNGTSSGVEWVRDDFFGQVMQCEEASGDFVTLDNVEYGGSGQFAVNLWMSYTAASQPGASFKYVFSHGKTDDEEAGPWSPNEVQIYLPEIAHPAHGVVRAIVKDEEDVYQGSMSRTFLDSDGGFMNNNARNIPGHVQLDDGKWHMVTVTTRPDGQPGFSIYVDGIMGGQAPPAFMNRTFGEVLNISVDGGDPIFPAGQIHLCGRNDKDPQRHFGGKLAHLSLFSDSLTDEQIMGMYAAGAGEAATLQRTLGLVLSQIPEELMNDGQLVASELGDEPVVGVGEVCLLPFQDPLEQIGRSFKGAKCAKGSICMPKADAPPNREDIGFHGVCVSAPVGDIMPELTSADSGSVFFPSPLAGVPVPYAFFPLTGKRLGSWPRDLFNGTSVNAGWAQDDLFGEVLECGDRSAVKLDPVPYASRGPFAVNFWMRNEGSYGGSFEYLFSHAYDDETDFNPFFPNQIQAYLPEIAHPAHGVVRTIVKDGDDRYNGPDSESFMDSDGLIADNGARDIPGHVNVTDDEWHMITLTSRGDGGDGYAVFVDGVLGGTNFLPLSQKEAPNGLPYHVDGGAPMNLDSHIFLCARSDLHPERHFKGKLSHLTLFDSALSPESIAAMFVSVKGDEALRKRLEEVIEAQRPPVEEVQEGQLEDLDNAMQGVRPPVVCGSDVTRCPDGTWVERTGPSCAFDCARHQTGRTKEVEDLDEAMQGVRPPEELGDLSEAIDDLQSQAPPSSSVGSGSTGAEDAPVDNKKAVEMAAGFGALIGAAVVLVLGLVVTVALFARRRKRQRQAGSLGGSAAGGGGSKGGMVALPTRSPAVSRNVSANMCISPMDSGALDSSEMTEVDVEAPGREASSGSVSVGEIVQTIKSKKNKKAASQYGELE